MNITVIGTGYVGLVAGVCLAESGNNVVCADIDEKKIAMLNAGRAPIYEAGLENLLKFNMGEKRLSFTSRLPVAIRKSDVVFIGVGTPMDERGKADLTAVFKCAETIGRSMNAYKTVVIKSTVPVGTADRVRKIIKSYSKKAFDVVSNPEFLKEGVAINDFMKPDRVIVGTKSKRAADIMNEIYASFIRTGAPLIVMDNRSAEMTKYASNAMLATKISFINELANLCDKVGANIADVRIGLGADRRIGHHFLFPGVGYGGSCFPKDLSALRYTASEYDMEMKIISAVEEVNEEQKIVLVDKIGRYYGGNVKGLTFSLWGLAFKANTDDVREAPAIEIIKALLERKVKLRVFDPKAMGNMKKIFGNRIRYGKDQYSILRGADALLILTDWNQFRRIDTLRLKRLMKKPVIFDGRNLLTPERVRHEKIQYISIGRP